MIMIPSLSLYQEMTMNVTNPVFLPPYLCSISHCSPRLIFPVTYNEFHYPHYSLNAPNCEIRGADHSHLLPSSIKLGLPLLTVVGHVFGYCWGTKWDYFKVLLLSKIIVDVKCDRKAISGTFCQWCPRR